ncbi:unnamed protein product, partial [Mesorhabditis spiculigera]
MVIGCFQYAVCECGREGYLDADYGPMVCQACKKEFIDALNNLQKDQETGERVVCLLNCGPDDACSFHRVLRCEARGFREDLIKRRK